MVLCFFFFKQKTAYEMRISDWSSDVCSSDLPLSTLIAVSPAHADESVTVNSAETANDVNAKIGAAQAAPDRNIAITISTKGEVVSPGSQIILAPEIGRASCRERVGQ